LIDDGVDDVGGKRRNVVLSDLRHVGRRPKAHVDLDVVEQPVVLVLLRVVAHPSADAKRGVSIGTKTEGSRSKDKPWETGTPRTLSVVASSVAKVGWSDGRHDGMVGQKTPLLIGTVKVGKIEYSLVKTVE
jgi:hypothetical protein